MDTPSDLAKRIRKEDGKLYTAGAVINWENETNVPPIPVINQLISILPLSAEELLRAMGVQLNPPEAQLLPPRLVEILRRRTPERLAGLIVFLGDQDQGRGQR